MGFWFFVLGLAVSPVLYIATRYVGGLLSSPSLADSIQWEALATEDLVLCKDGAYIAVWEISGPDMSFSSAARADKLADNVADLLNVLDGNSMLHVETVRVPSTEYASPDSEDIPPVARFTDQQRKKDYQDGDHFENRTFLALTLGSQQQSAYSFLSAFMYSGNVDMTASTEEKVSAAQNRATEFSQFIPKALSPRRLSGDDLTSFLYLMMTGRDQDVTAPPSEYASLRYLAAHDVRSGFQTKIGDRWYGVVGIWGYPESVSVGVSESLHDVSFSYRFSNRLVGVDTSEALRQIQRRTGQYNVQGNDFFSLLSDNPERSDPDDLYQDDHAKEMAFETKDVEREVQAGHSLVHHTGAVIVWGESKEQCQTRITEVKKHLRNAGGGFLVDQETGMATEAVIGSWPGHGGPNKRRYLLMNYAAARILPITGTYAGPEETPCSFYQNEDGSQPPPLFYSSTQEDVPYRFTPYGQSGDVGHQAVIGPTGTGKSILLGFQAMRQLHFKGGRSIVFDRGHSFAPLTEALGGTYYDLDNIQDGFKPLADIEEESERQWAVSWICDLVSQQNVDVTPTRRRRISEVLNQMAQTTDRRTLSDLQTLLAPQDKALSRAMDPFTGGGELGDLLNSTTDHFRDSHMITIELGNLANFSSKIFAPVLTFFFHKIETLLSPSRPTHVIADEFYMLASNSPTALEKIEEALRLYRKENAFLTVGSQDPGDLVQGDTGAGILGQIKTQIMLPNPRALKPAQKSAYKEIGLTEEQIQLVASAEPKREYIVIQPGGARKIDLGLDSELLFQTPYKDLSFKETARMIRNMKSEYGSKWIHEWTKLRGREDLANDAPLDKKRRDGRRPTKLLPAPGQTEELPPPGDPKLIEERIRHGDGAEVMTGPEEGA